MQPVPDQRAEKTKDVSDHTSDYDERNGRRRIEWFDEVHPLDHMRPENEIEDRLRPADQNKKRPSQMPAAHQRADYQSNFVGIRHSSVFVISRFYLRVCRKKPAPGIRWVIDQKRV